MRKLSSLLLMFLPGVLAAQNEADPNAAALRAIIVRLDKLESRNEQLEKQNRDLMTELVSIRSAMANSLPAAPTQFAQPALVERVTVAETRVEEQAQTKVEAGQRFPVTLNGLVLFNAFLNNRAGSRSGWSSYLLSGPSRTGATVSQTQLGFDFHGPDLPGDGKMSGSLNLDFLGGTGNAYGYNVRLRRALVNLDWKSRSVSFGQDKPLISRREPNSLASVAYPALSDVGNPWVWVPQVRYVERIQPSGNMGIDLEGSVLATSETLTGWSGQPVYALEATRPALETRANFWRNAGENSRFEIAPGFHVSTTHVAGYSVPSQFGTLDYLARPVKWLQITGLVFAGRNMANLGGFSSGFSLLRGSDPRAVRGLGGWTQLSFSITPRLTLNTFGGLQAPRMADLAPGALTHASAFAGNLIYRLAPNVLIGAEALQERTGYFDRSHVIRNHYDLAIGYLF